MPEPSAREVSNRSRTPLSNDSTVPLQPPSGGSRSSCTFTPASAGSGGTSVATITPRGVVRSRTVSAGPRRSRPSAWMSHGSAQRNTSPPAGERTFGYGGVLGGIAPAGGGGEGGRRAPAAQREPRGPSDRVQAPPRHAARVDAGRDQLLPEHSRHRPAPQ